MRRSIGTLLLAVAGLAVIAACAASSEDPDVVARMPDGSPLTRTDLTEWEAELSPAESRRLAEESQHSHRQRLLEQFVVGRLLDRRLETWERELPEEVEQQLARERTNRLRARVEQLLAVPRIAVTPEEARSHYDEHPELFGHQGRIRVRHIFRRVDREATDAVRQRVRADLEDLRAQLLSGANFEDLARAHSDSETAVHGGLIGVLDPGVLGEPIDSILWSLEERQISQVVSTPVGFHVFRVDKKIAPSRTSYEEAEKRIYRRLERRKTEQVHAELLEELLAASGAEFHPSRLDSPDEQTVLFALAEKTLTLDSWRKNLAAMSFSEAREKPQRAMLADWALGQLYSWEAERRGLDESPELGEVLEVARTAYLADWIRRDARRQAIEGLGDDLLRRYFEEEKSRFQTPRRLDLSILVRRFPEKEKDWYGVYEELEGIARAIREGEAEFDSEARRLSEDFSSAQGGRIGPIRMTSFEEWAGPAAQDRVLALEPGRVSEPILVERYVIEQLTYDRYGYLLALVHEVLEPTTPSFEEAREPIVQRLVRAAPSDIEARIRRSILESSGAELFPGNLP